jgi:integrase
MLKENNTRKGFFEPDQFRAVFSYLPMDVRPLAVAAYVTGWRVKDELLTREWKHIDFNAGWVRLEPGETKNNEGRMFPLTPDLRAVLEAHRAHTHAVERDTGIVIRHVFHRRDKLIRTYRRSWLTACRKAGVPGRIPHDFRRTAVRNLERAGVPRSAAMAMVGHKTESIYRRYAITDEAMLKEGAAKLAALHEAQRSAVAKIVPISERVKVRVKSGSARTSSATSE